jgi:hypothetical protein
MRKLMKVILVLAVVGLFPLTAFADRNGDDYYLNFNPYGYTTEFFTVNGIRRGSCGAAAVVLVENHLKLGSSIPANAVKDKNTQMGCSLSGSYYICSITGIANRLRADGYRVDTTLTTTNKDTAAKNIYNALAVNRWVIVVARHNFNTSELGHFYPVYGGTLKKDSRGNIDYARSTINVIEDFNVGFYNRPNTSWWNWDAMYRKPNLGTMMTSMASASGNGKTYNIISVYK